MDTSDRFALAAGKPAALQEKAATDTDDKRGAKKIVRLNFDPAPAAAASQVTVPGVSAPVAVPAGERLEDVEIEDDGPEETQTHATVDTQATTDKHLDLTLTPPPAIALPRRTVGVDLQVLPEKAVGAHGSWYFSDHFGVHAQVEDVLHPLQGVSVGPEFRF